MNLPESRISLEHVAALAKLSVDPAEAASLLADLKAMLAFARTIQETDLSGIPETSHVLSVENVLREDLPSGSLGRQTLLNSAPVQDGTYILVPAALSQGGEGA